MEQGKAKGEGQQHGVVWSGYLRQASHWSSQVQAHHPFHSLWPYEGTSLLPMMLFDYLLQQMLYHSIFATLVLI